MSCEREAAAYGLIGWDRCPLVEEVSVYHSDDTSLTLLPVNHIPQGIYTSNITFWFVLHQVTLSFKMDSFVQTELVDKSPCKCPEILAAVGKWAHLAGNQLTSHDFVFFSLNSLLAAVNSGLGLFMKDFHIELYWLNMIVSNYLDDIIWYF